MITRMVRIQLIVFLILTLVGTAFVGLRYVGLADKLLDNIYVVDADFAASGGVFTNASVTYRGVPVGRVGELTPTRNGIRIQLRLEKGVSIPRDLRAVTTNRSAIGEQHIDLRPNTESGPYLKPGDVIPASRTGIPLPVEQLVLHLDTLSKSVDPEDLAVLVDELGKAFEGNEESLGRLLDANDLLLSDAKKHLPETIALIRDSRTVLETQELSGDAIRRWAAGLAKLSGTLKDSDVDLRKILANGPPATREVITLLRDVQPNIGVLLGNLITVNGIASRRIENLMAVLVVLPASLAGAPTVAPSSDGYAHLGLALSFDDPPPCVYSNSGKSPYCTGSEREGGSDVRGWQNAGRRPGPEISPAPLGGREPPRERTDSGSSGSGSSSSSTDTSGATFDPTTGLIVGSDGEPLQFGATGGQYALVGPESWKELLYAGIAS
jgi:phospholipid/cholesterol/gamma-HCH transport system substrate-binding protein